jgi:hypothetical protein
VVVRFAPDAAPFLDENKHRHDTQSIRRQDDGSVLFSVQLPDHDGVKFQFRRWVLSWGRSAEVLAPATFRSAIAEELAGLSAVYATERDSVVPALTQPVG